MTPGEAANRAGLLGAWRLLTWESIAEDGTVTHPMGEDPEGVVVYTPDGTMMTTLGRAGRTPITGGDMMGGPEDERLAAFSSFVAYQSRFHMDGGDIIHVVEMSLFPNWVGTAQRRHVELSADGRSLVLSSDPFLLRGRMTSQRLAWVRIEGS
jgi:hypothetical protein